jgi:drug/metabolite transporter, DME family
VTLDVIVDVPRAVRRKTFFGCGLVILAGIILSLGVFCVRSATASHAWQYIFWRAIGFTAALLVISTMRGQRSALHQIAHLRPMAWIAACSMALSQVTFIYSIKAATFAEVFLICSLAPLMAAALAWPLLRERISWITGVAIALSIAGVYVMTGGELNTANAHGQFVALVAMLGFAGYTLCTRGSRSEDLDATLIAVGVLTIISSASAIHYSGLQFHAGMNETLIAVGHGAVLLAAGLFLFGQGSRYISAVTFTMLAQAEAVLAPIWGYLYFAEIPTQATLVGGGLILTAVILQALVGGSVAASAPRR